MHVVMCSERVAPSRYSSTLTGKTADVWKKIEREGIPGDGEDTRVLIMKRDMRSRMSLAEIMFFASPFHFFIEMRTLSNKDIYNAYTGMKRSFSVTDPLRVRSRETR